MPSQAQPIVSTAETHFRTALATLHDSAREVTLQNLQASLLRHKQEMNRRGLLHCSFAANAAGELCRASYCDLASSLWECFTKVHSAHPETEQSPARSAFMELLESSYSVVEGIHRSEAARCALCKTRCSRNKFHVRVSSQTVS